MSVNWSIVTTGVNFILSHIVLFGRWAQEPSGADLAHQPTCPCITRITPNESSEVSLFTVISRFFSRIAKCRAYFIANWSFIHRYREIEIIDINSDPIVLPHALTLKYYLISIKYHIEYIFSEPALDAQVFHHPPHSPRPVPPIIQPFRSLFKSWRYPDSFKTAKTFHCARHLALEHICQVYFKIFSMIEAVSSLMIKQHILDQHLWSDMRYWSDHLCSSWKCLRLLYSFYFHWLWDQRVLTIITKRKHSPRTTAQLTHHGFYSLLFGVLGSKSHARPITPSKPIAMGFTTQIPVFWLTIPVTNGATAPPLDPIALINDSALTSSSLLCKRVKLEMANA